MIKISLNNATYFLCFHSFLKTRTQAYHTETLLAIEVATSICILLQDHIELLKTKRGKSETIIFEWRKAEVGTMFLGITCRDFTSDTIKTSGHLHRLSLLRKNVFPKCPNKPIFLHCVRTPKMNILSAPWMALKGDPSVFRGLKCERPPPYFRLYTKVKERNINHVVMLEIRLSHYWLVELSSSGL